MTGLFQNTRHCISEILRGPARRADSLRQIVERQNLMLTALSRQIEIAHDGLRRISALHDDLLALHPGRNELGADDPRTAVNLFKAVCAMATQETLAIIRDMMPNALCELDHRAFLLKSIAAAPKAGVIAEFGVFSGTTMRWMANEHPERGFVGFDNFVGLPSEWTGYKTFDFNRSAKPPELPKNVELIIGDFKQTVPEFAKTLPSISVMHIDSDLYESADTVLRHLQSSLRPGSVLIFDEFFNYPNFQAHEMRACSEFLKRARLEIDWLYYSGERASGRLRAA